MPDFAPDFVAVPEADDWKLLTGGDWPSGRCRYTMANRRACGRPAVAALDRGNQRRSNWWAYCEQHLFGRWIENDVVMCWRAVWPDEASGT